MSGETTTITLERLRQLELLDGNASAAETRELVRAYRFMVYGINAPAAEPEPLEPGRVPR